MGCEAANANPYVVEQPKLIVEVLSDSTERNDRSDKFYGYRRLASLEEYVLIAQDVQCECIDARVAGIWRFTRLQRNLTCVALGWIWRWRMFMRAFFNWF